MSASKVPPPQGDCLGATARMLEIAGGTARKKSRISKLIRPLSRRAARSTSQRASKNPLTWSAEIPRRRACSCALHRDPVRPLNAIVRPPSGLCPALLPEPTIGATGAVPSHLIWSKESDTDDKAVVPPAPPNVLDPPNESGPVDETNSRRRAGERASRRALAGNAPAARDRIRCARSSSSRPTALAEWRLCHPRRC